MTPTGLLVMAYGTASGPGDIERYYTDIRGGRTPSPELIEDLRQRYAAIGNEFPLDRITRQQAAALEQELNRNGDRRWTSYVGYKHSPPFVGDAVRQMTDDGVTEAVGIVMAPQYSRMSIGGYIDRARESIGEAQLSLDVIESWHLHPGFVEVLADRVRAARDVLSDDERVDDLTLFTAHSLPERITREGDPYPDQLQETADAVAAAAGLDRYRIAWQSAGRTGEPWIGPSLEEAIDEAADEGRTAVVVCPCGFTADHLEILYDIDIEAQGVAEKRGVRLVRTESMNADPPFISAVARMVLDHVAGRTKEAP